MEIEKQIRKEILALPPTKRGELLRWLIEMDKQDWDQELEEDFSGKGPGVSLLEQVKADFRSGRCAPWE